MKPRDIFGLIVRVAGFGSILAGIFDLIHLAVVWLGLPLASNYPQAATATAAGIYIVIGCTIIVSAEFITCLAYGRDDRSN